jgi:hypothetical protein
MDERIPTGAARSYESLEAARWSKICDILYAALALHAEERERYVERACGGDNRLRSEVERLIAATERPAAIDLPSPTQLNDLV